LIRYLLIISKHGGDHDFASLSEKLLLSHLAALQSFIIFSCCIVIVLALQSLAEEKKLLPAFAYPTEIAIPKSVPAYKVVQKEKDPREGTKVIIPAATWITSHYDGWQEFLKLLRDHGASELERPWKDPISQLNTEGSWIREGKRAGYERCRETIKNLVRNKPNASDQIIQDAIKTHRLRGE
jgi:hypothetical protein